MKYYTLEDRLHIFDLVELGLWEHAAIEAADIYRNFTVKLDQRGVVVVTFVAKDILNHSKKVIEDLNHMNRVKKNLREYNRIN